MTTLTMAARLIRSPKPAGPLTAPFLPGIECPLCGPLKHLDPVRGGASCIGREDGPALTRGHFLPTLNGRNEAYMPQG